MICEEKVVDKHENLDDILLIVRRFIITVMDEEESELEIERHTSFQDDLELESIEMIALGDELQNYYGDQLDFASWLAQLDLQDLMSLTVGDLVQWIEDTLM
jgi:acyl carrier protein